MTDPDRCSVCGARLEGRQARPGGRVCGDCGAAIASSPADPIPAPSRAAGLQARHPSQAGPAASRPAWIVAVSLLAAAIGAGLGVLAFRGEEPAAGPPAAAHDAVVDSPGGSSPSPVDSPRESPQRAADLQAFRDSRARYFAARQERLQRAASRRESSPARTRVRAVAPAGRSGDAAELGKPLRRDEGVVVIPTPAGIETPSMIFDESAPGEASSATSSARPSAFRPDDPQQAAPELLAKVADLFEKSPRTPIVPPAEVQRGMDYGGEWLTEPQVVERLYERYGHTDDRWAAAARRLIRLSFAPGIPDAFTDARIARLAELERLQRDTVDAGCSDPLLWSACLSSFGKMDRLDRAMPLLRRSIDAPPESNYPRHVLLRFQTAVMAPVVQGVGGFDNETKMKLRERMRTEAIAAAGERIDRLAHPRFLRAVLWDARNAFPVAAQAAFLEAVVAAPGIDPWVAAMLLAQEHRDMGWKARGDGFADRVTAGGRREFGIHIRQSTAHLLTAWGLHPEYPEAATELIRNVMAIGGAAGESPRFWLDQALAADPTHALAFTYYRWSLRPRWGGSYDALLAFGIECLATNRHDLGIPEQFHKAALDIVSDSRDMANWLQSRGVPGQRITGIFGLGQFVRVPGVYENYRKLCLGRLEWSKSQNRPDLMSVARTQLAAIAFLTGRLEDVRGIAVGPDSRFEQNELGHWGIPLPYLQRVVASAVASDVPPSNQVAVHRGAARAVAVTPDARRLVSGGEDGVVLIVDPDTGRELSRLDIGFPVFGLAISPDGDRIAVGGGRREIQLWNIAERRRERVLKTTGQLAWTLAFSPDGKTLASGGGIDPGSETPGELLLWNVADGSIRAALTGHRRPIRKVAFSPDGRILASAAGNARHEVWNAVPGELILWDTVTGERMPAALEFVGCVDAFAFSPDGKSIVAVEEFMLRKEDAIDWPGRLLRFDVAGGAPTILKENVDRVRCLEFAPDGKTFATGDGLGTIRIWDSLARGSDELAVFLGHRTEVESIAFAPDGRLLLSGDRSGRTLAWKLAPNARPASRFGESLEGHATIGQVLGLRYSPDGKRLYALDERIGVLEWDAADGFRSRRVLGFQCLAFGSPTVTAFDVSPDGARLAVARTPGDGPAEVRLYDLGTGALKHTLPGGRLLINTARFTPDNRSLVIGEAGGGVELWDLSQELPAAWARRDDSSACAAVSPDGRWLVRGEYLQLRLAPIPAREGGRGGAPVSLADEFTGTSPNEHIVGLSFSNDGARLAVCADFKGGIWDVERREYPYQFSGRFLCFSADGSAFFTAVPDYGEGPIRIWNADTGLESQTLSGGHYENVEAAVCSPDGKWLISSGVDRRLRVWDLSTGKRAAGRPDSG